MARGGRKILIDGQMRSFEDLHTLKSSELSGASVDSKLWRYKKNGDIESFAEGDIQDDDIVFGGSKSDLRRLEDIERNISVLATKTMIASSISDYDSDDDAFNNVFDKKVRFKNEDVRFTNSNIKIDSNTTIDLNGVKLTEVGTPSNSADAATKGYVDDLIAGSNEIGELTDVTVSSASTGQILKYNGSAWVNTAEVNELNELTGVTISSVSNGQVLKYNGSAWVNAADAGGIALTDLSVGAEGSASGDGSIAYNNSTGVFTYSPPTAAGIGALVDLTSSNLGTLADVTISSLQTDQVLKYNGSAWVNGTGGSATTYVASAGAPSSPADGDEWYDTDNGNFYKYINDGTTKQWVEWSPGQSGPMLDGTVAVTGVILPDGDNTRDLGSSAKQFKEIHAVAFSGKASSAQYADLAEMYAGDKDYEVGTVVIVGGTHEVTECGKYASSQIAGVVSDKPAYLMNKDIDAEHPVCVGFVGRVPIKVVGHIEKGDMLTSSEIKGYATKFSGNYQPGCIIGLALNNKVDEQDTVEVLLKRS